ncbi:hypothetical protein SAMN05444172_8846 [Burkholderia sp. GAS332]|nr:hypothetical protein SAMN05444172_8846 [Burkholderia sp. GAS332]
MDIAGKEAAGVVAFHVRNKTPDCARPTPKGRIVPAKATGALKRDAASRPYANSIWRTNLDWPAGN